MKTFRQFFEQNESKSLTATFGRFNPPTIGHEKVFNKLEDIAGGGDFKIYASQTHKKQKDKKGFYKDPISYDDKVKFMKEMFPEYENNIVYDTDIRTIWDILTRAYNDGYTKLTLVFGEDRLGQGDQSMEELIKKWHGNEGAHGFYEFVDGLEFENAGERVEGAVGVEGMSASKLKDAVYRDDFQEFVKGLPAGYTYSHELFDAVKEGMGLPSDEELATFISSDRLKDVNPND